MANWARRLGSFVRTTGKTVRRSWEELEVGGPPLETAIGQVLAARFEQEAPVDRDAAVVSRVEDIGVHPKDAQELMRHSTVDLTLSVYTHTTRRKLAAALDALPNRSQLTAERAKRTGTDDCAAVSAAAEHSAPNGVERLVTTQRDAVTTQPDGAAASAGNTEKTREKRDSGTGRGGIRTRTTVTGQGILSPPANTTQPANPQGVTSSPENVLASRLALSAQKPGVSAPDDPDLAAVVEAWPSLPEPVKAGVVAMVKAAAQG